MRITRNSSRNGGEQTRGLFSREKGPCGPCPVYQRVSQHPIDSPATSTTNWHLVHKPPGTQGQDGNYNFIAKPNYPYCLAFPIGEEFPKRPCFPPILTIVFAGKWQSPGPIPGHAGSCNEHGKAFGINSVRAEPGPLPNSCQLGCAWPKVPSSFC